MTPVIGIDFDNTIINYNQSFYKIAVENGLTNKNIRKSKKTIRNAVRRLPDGENSWQKLQALAYGPMINEATPMEGIFDFLQQCKNLKLPVAVVSHKTEYASFDSTRTNLREVAIKWLTANRFFSSGLLDDGSVYFESTRQEKINRIKALDCTHFIDDLEETFLEPSFPAINKFLLLPEGEYAAPADNLTVVNCWRQITEQILAAHHISLVMTASSGDLRLLGGGRNSRVYSFTANSKKHVAKFYHTNPGDPRNRMMTELTALQFLHTIGFMDIPSPVAFGADRGLAVHEYIDGSPLDAASVSISDIDASVDFLKRLHKARLHPDAEAIGNASEACFAIQELAANIRARLDPLRKVSGNKPGLREFLEKELVPAFSRHMESLSDNMPAPAPRSNQTLSPSDFGFHNAIRRPDGSLCFCDFEYFGWDDPAKMISDFLLHPADRMQFELKLKKRFFDSIIEEFDPALPGRVEAIFPLYAIKWCIILLNEFLEDQFDRRAFATTAPLSRSDTEARQLEKARIMLKKNLKEFT